MISFLRVLHSLGHSKRFTELSREKKGEGGEEKGAKAKGRSKTKSALLAAI